MSETADLFTIQRHTDVTGVSGTGAVADGVVWPDGTVTIRWRGDRQSTVNWNNLDDALAVHGHDGATAFVFAPRMPEIERMVQLIADLTDPDDCSFDHHGGCQAHGYLSLKPGELCPHQEAKNLLADAEFAASEGGVR